MSESRGGDAHREHDAICEAEEELLSVREGWHAVTPSEPTARLQHLVGGELIASFFMRDEPRQSVVRGAPPPCARALELAVGSV